MDEMPNRPSNAKGFLMTLVDAQGRCRRLTEQATDEREAHYKVIQEWLDRAYAEAYAIAAEIEAEDKTGVFTVPKQP